MIFANLPPVLDLEIVRMLMFIDCEIDCWPRTGLNPNMALMTGDQVYSEDICFC